MLARAGAKEESRETQTLEDDLVAALQRYKMEVRVANMRRNHLSYEGEMRIGVIDACIGRVLETLKEREEALSDIADLKHRASMADFAEDDDERAAILKGPGT